MLKEAFVEAFNKSGGISSLTKWAKMNPEKFYPMLVRLLTKEIKPKGCPRVVSNQTIYLNEEAKALELNPKR